MKKLFVIAAVALTGFMASCNQTPTSKMESDIDTLSYAIGMAQTNGLKDYLVMRMGVDTAYIDAFLKGFYEAAQNADDAKKTAYYAGLQIGQQVSGGMVKNINQMIYGEDSVNSINAELLYAGFIAGVQQKYDVMTFDSASTYAQENMEKVQNRVKEEKYGENRQAGEDFIAAKAQEEGVQELGEGVYYKVITEGKGDVAQATDRVKVHYEGKLIDGTVFDGNMDKDATVFGANQVIPGFKAALTTMPVGSEWEVYIPQDQAYGAQDMGQIKPFSALVFTIKLEEIVK